MLFIFGGYILADLRKEIEKRRTFAIISHPDAGKTTLTEKFLLYGGAINLAGSVKGRREVSLSLLLYYSLIMAVTVSIFWIRRDIRTSRRIPTVL